MCQRPDPPAPPGSYRGGGWYDFDAAARRRLPPTGRGRLGRGIGDTLPAIGDLLMCNRTPPPGPRDRWGQPLNIGGQHAPDQAPRRWPPLGHPRTNGKTTHFEQVWPTPEQQELIDMCDTRVPGGSGSLPGYPDRRWGPHGFADIPVITPAFRRLGLHVHRGMTPFGLDTHAADCRWRRFCAWFGIGNLPEASSC